MEEIWKPIKGFEGYYEISSHGRVKSLERTIIRKDGIFHRRKERILTNVENQKTHYIQVMLICHKRYKLFYIHRLVGQAFVENPNNYKIITHLDGDLNNNNADNLRWVSRSSNENKRLNLI